MIDLKQLTSPPSKRNKDLSKKVVCFYGKAIKWSMISDTTWLLFFTGGFQVVPTAAGLGWEMQIRGLTGSHPELFK